MRDAGRCAGDETQWPGRERRASIASMFTVVAIAARLDRERSLSDAARPEAGDAFERSTTRG